MVTMSRRTVAEPGVPGSAPATASSSSRPWCAGSSSSGAAEYTPPCSGGGRSAVCRASPHSEAHRRGACKQYGDRWSGQDWIDGLLM